MHAVLNQTAALPIDEEDDQRYPILGHLVWYSLRDVRITRDELAHLFLKNGIDPNSLPAEIRAPDAFRRATTSIATRTPQKIESGRFENIMVREVVNDSAEIVRYIVREVTDSKNRRLDYGQIGTAVFGREMETVRVRIDPRYEHLKRSIDARYTEYSDYYTGKHIRDIVFRLLHQTFPVSVRPAGGVYFVSRAHADLVSSLEEFITDINAYGVPGTAEAVFESVPMLDIEKQRKLIFDKYESQCAYSVDTTLGELAGLLRSERVPTKGVVADYINKVKELKDGIAKYENLLERDLSLARAKCTALQQQVKALLDKAAVSELVPDATEAV